MQPRLRALFLLNRKALKGVHGEGRKRDDKGAGDPKSEKEIFLAVLKIWRSRSKSILLFVSLKKFFNTYNMQNIESY